MDRDVLFVSCPKSVFDHAITLALQENVILATLGDMLKVPESSSSLAKVRAKGADVRALYSTFDALKIAKENPSKKVIFFAIGFETTTPMTAALMDRAFKEKVENLFYYINHVRVAPPIRALMDSKETSINAFIGPSNVSVIIGAKSYTFLQAYNTPVTVAGFEPVDVMESILMLIRQKNESRCEVEIQYTRATTWEGNLVAQKLIEQYFRIADSFRWRGLGDIAHSAYTIKEEFTEFDAQKVWAEFLSNERIDDHKLCICGDILKGKSTPTQCTVFGSVCMPSNPLGSYIVSDEGACNAYFRYRV